LTPASGCSAAEFKLLEAARGGLLQNLVRAAPVTAPAIVDVLAVLRAESSRCCRPCTNAIRRLPVAAVFQPSNEILLHYAGGEAAASGDPAATPPRANARLLSLGRFAASR